MSDMSLSEIQKLQDDFQKKLLEANPTSHLQIPEALRADAYQHADYACEVIMQHIKNFEDELDNEHEVAVKLAAFGQSITLSVVSIEYSNPSTIVFSGYVGAQPARLIQHMSQLNFLLVAVKKSSPEKPAHRIKLGFHVPSDD